ncbi:OsmC family protein [Dongia sp.]|uniref:OsmC family protein n=1 Tax=Dongia sp. TaxID=1977262 RepID=UPI0035AF3E09
MSMTKAANKNAPANIVNGIDLDALHETVAAIEQDPTRALLRFRVATQWLGQTRTRATIEGFERAGEWIERGFTIAADEPTELLGSNTAPNPQELLMAGLNACMSVGYVAGAATRGITLNHLRIESEGRIDVRGFLGHPDVPAGYTEIKLKVEIGGNGSAEQFREIHEAVLKTSPNVFNLTQPVRIAADLAIRG